jgi:hypothetical protein
MSVTAVLRISLMMIDILQHVPGPWKEATTSCGVSLHETDPTAKAASSGGGIA